MKTPFNGRLIDGVLWTLKEFDEVTPSEMAKIIGYGWKTKQVADEIRRVKSTFLGNWIVKKKLKANICTYSLDSKAKSASIDFLKDMCNKSFVFPIRKTPPDLTQI